MVRCSCVALFYCSLSLSHTHTHSIFGEIDINTAHIVGFTFAGRVLLIVFMWSVWWLLHIVQFPHVVVTADAVFLPPPPPALSSLNVRYSFRNYFKYNLIFLVTCLHTTMESVRYKWMFVIFTYATIIVMYNIRILMLNILALSLSLSLYHLVLSERNSFNACTLYWWCSDPCIHFLFSLLSLMWSSMSHYRPFMCVRAYACEPIFPQQKFCSIYFMCSPV